MGHTNDEESDFEGYKLKDIVTDEESGVDLNNENILCQFDFFSILIFFFSLCLTLQARNEVIFAQQCLKDILSNVSIKYGWKLNCNHVFSKVYINLELSYFPSSGIHIGSTLETDRVPLG